VKEKAMKQAIIGLAAIGLAGCATYGGDAPPDQASAPAAPEALTCNAAPAQYHIGHDATQAMGAAILKDSGARSLRWGPPNSAWTLDFREDRVNVRYDDKMKITEVTCG
jgi:Peptidase inhibitor I78 family